MSNYTATTGGVDIGYEYSTYILGAMFVTSEILPLLKGKSNGLLHALLCLIQGSKCLLENVEEKVQARIEKADGMPKNSGDVP